MKNKKYFAHIVAPIFKKHNWKWHKTGVPSENDIIKTLLYLEHDAFECKGEASTGRLMVKYTDSGFEYYLEVTLE